MTDLAGTKGKNNFEELRYLDLKINEQMSTERRHLETNVDEITKDLILSKNNIHDLISMILDLHLEDPKIKNSIKKIETYFNGKSDQITRFQNAMKELRAAADHLHPLYREIQKHNIKFVLDNRDFYRDCMTDTFWYLMAPSTNNEKKLYEDKKILTQIIAIASKPDPNVQHYATAIETIINRNIELEEIFSQVKQKTIDEEMAYVSSYFRDEKNSQNDDGQFFLALIFIAIIVYIISLVIILRKF
jgi:hypothetical protein